MGEQVDFAVSDFQASACSLAEFSFLLSSGEGLPSFMISSGSTVSVAPSTNEEAGDFEIKASITYLGET